MVFSIFIPTCPLLLLKDLCLSLYIIKHTSRGFHLNAKYAFQDPINLPWIIKQSYMILAIYQLSRNYLKTLTLDHKVISCKQTTTTRFNALCKIVLFNGWFSTIFCMPRQIKLNNLHFNCPFSLIVVTKNHNVFRHKSLRIICGWIYAGYSEILCDTLYNRAANCWGLGVMWLTSWPPAFPDCHLLLVFQHSLSPRASQYPK